MDSNTNDSGRRTFIQGMAAMVGGFASLSSCAPGAQPAALGGGTVAPGGGVSLDGAFSLLGTGRPLPPPPVGGLVDRSAMAFGGDLLRAGGGGAVGRFHAQPLGRSGGGGMELLLLEFADGALYAAGPGGGSRDLRSYAVLGGTGSLAGARGTFTTREIPGPSGLTLEFSGTLTS